MTPEQRIKRELLHVVIESEWREVECEDVITENNVDDLYGELLVEKDLHWECKAKFRESGEDTDLPCECCRHYESKSVACRLRDGTWVGWTYWYGGGKHGEPEAVEWMDDAYELDVTEEEKLVVVRTFKVVGDDQ